MGVYLNLYEYAYVRLCTNVCMHKTRTTHIIMLEKEEPECKIELTEMPSLHNNAPNLVL